MELKLLGKLGSGQYVYDRFQSHLSLEVSDLIAEALGMIHLSDEEFTKVLVDFGRIIGFRTCVETGPEDKIVFAQRSKRKGLTRFVRERHPEPCSTMLVVLKQKKDEPKGYILITAFIGEKSEVEPWDSRATERSLEFWRAHALIWDESLIVPGTETSEPPW